MASKNKLRTQSLKRGDVVWVNLDPTVGAEIRKKSRIGATLGKLNRTEIESIEQGLRTVLEL